jgi:ATP-binding cassette, subfamily C (CFTR/MRP), member 1
MSAETLAAIWVSWWSEANTAQPNDRVDMHMGIYAMLGVLGTIAGILAAG